MNDKTAQKRREKYMRPIIELANAYENEISNKPNKIEYSNTVMAISQIRKAANAILKY